jgi:hypothetical protein
MCNLQSATISNTHNPTPNTNLDTRKAKKAEWNRQYRLRGGGNKPTVAENNVHQKGEPLGQRVKVQNPSNYTQGVTENMATTTNTKQGNKTTWKNY